ncbi:unnamed protein product [Calicophoron daubneyi]
MLLCKQDYLRLFGMSGTCAKCRIKIPPDELVMRCQENVYHLNCFCCVQCHTLLHPGDKVCLLNGNPYCEHEFPHLFSSIKWTSGKRSQSAGDPVVSSQTDLMRSLIAQDINMGGKGGGGGFVRSSPNNFANPDGPSGSGNSYSIMPITHSELAAVMSSHPTSPNGGMTLLNPNHVISDTSPVAGSAFCFNEMDSSSFATDSGPIGQPLPPDKPIKSSDAPVGRKKQKKVDSRRCALLRVC